MRLNKFGDLLATVADSTFADGANEVAEIVQNEAGVLYQSKEGWRYRRQDRRIGLAVGCAGGQFSLVLRAPLDSGWGHEKALEIAQRETMTISTAQIPEGYSITRRDEIPTAVPEALGNLIHPGSSISSETGAPGTVGCLVTFKDENE